MIPFDYDLGSTGEQKPRTGAPRRPEDAEDDPFVALTDDHLRAWAGVTTFARGTTYQRQGRVTQLARTVEDKLIAWVRGTERYATLVAVDDGTLSSTCSCPVGYACKHAVAVTLEHRTQVEAGQAVPLADEADRRLALLDAAAADEDPWDEWDGDPDADDDDYEDEELLEPPARRTARATTSRVAAADSTADLVRQFLDGQTKEQLVALIEQFAAAHPAVRTALTDRAELASGSVANLARSAQRDIDGLDVEVSWDNRRSMDPRVRLRRVRERLATLLAGGHVDEVVQLGNALVERGFELVQMIDDEGETGVALQECLAVVVEALPRSSLAPVEQMLWVVDAEQRDPYDALDTEAFWEIERSVETWSAFADALGRRLRADTASSSPDTYSRDYARDQLTNELVAALRNAERDDEVIPLLEREAARTNSYVRLVRELRHAGRLEEADAWARKGIAATTQQWPGIAGELSRLLSELRAEAGDWVAVAAIRAAEFFRYPSVGGLRALEEAAGRAGVRDEVRAAALRFLETGHLPFARPPKEASQAAPSVPKPRRGRPGSGTTTGTRAGGTPTARTGRDATGRADPEDTNATAVTWPLPDLELGASAPGPGGGRPRLDVLVELAIEERRPADVLRWHAELRRARSDSWGWRGDLTPLDDRVADAVAETHPEAAIAIWKQRAEGQINLTDVRAYEAAAGYLEKLRPVLGEEAWRDYVAGLREANRRKRRLVEILDDLVARPPGR